MIKLILRIPLLFLSTSSCISPKADVGHLHPVFCYNNNEHKICIFKLLTSIYNYFIKEKIPVTFGPMFYTSFATKLVYHYRKGDTCDMFSESSTRVLFSRESWRRGLVNGFHFFDISKDLFAFLFDYYFTV